MQRQRGGALIVGLIILFAISVAGVSSMRGSSLDYRMASGFVQAIDVFQAAESSNEVLLGDLDKLVEAQGSADGTLTVSTSIRDGIDMTSKATLRYVGAGLASGHSLGDYDALHYIVEGEAEIGSGETARRVRQGAYRVVPSID